MTTTFDEGDRVAWRWGQGRGEGRIREVFTAPVTRTLKGTEVTRDADADNPAYLVEQDDGDEVLKSASELETP